MKVEKAEAPKKKEQYCKNSQMLIELNKFQEDGIISENLGQMFIDITTRLGGHSYFRNYDHTTKNDLKSAALLKMVKAVEKYNMKFKNPFAYFTQVAFNEFRKICKSYYKHINIRRKIASNYYVAAESANIISSNSTIATNLREIMDPNGYTEDD